MFLVVIFNLHLCLKRGLMILGAKKDNPEETQEDKEKYTEAQIRCQNNLAAAYLKVHTWRYVKILQCFIHLK